MTERLDKMRMELRRGALVLAVLAALREEQYGYSLRKRLVQAQIDIEEGTLYPLVRRLEGYGLLDSHWSESNGRKKRYYKISAAGESLLADLQGEWSALSASLDNLLEDSK
jgi:DNA-binding PadR family transcriptional regulator